MAVTYPWKWLRGQKLTAKFDNGTTAHDMTYQPAILSSNLLEVPTQGAELIGVVESEASASEKHVPVIISNDIFEVQLASGENPGLGDEVTIEADGSVSVREAGDSICGVVVDYDPASAGIAHIRANFEALERVVVTDIGTGEVGTTQLAAECTEKVVLTHIIEGDITSEPVDAIIGIGAGAGTIVKAGFAMLERGIDDDDALSLEMNVAIGGSTIFTTEPKIAEKAGGAATSFEAGDDIVVGVIDTTADDVAEFDVITVDWTLVRTTPGTEANGICVYVEIEYKVGV
jgi:hypothetical protein